MRNEIQDWLSALQRQIENVLEPYLGGYFMTSGSPVGRRLPSIEIFALQGISNANDQLEQWTDRARAWLDSYEFIPKFDVSFGTNCYLFTPSFERFPEPRRLIANRVVIEWNQYLEDQDLIVPPPSNPRLHVLRPFGLLDELSSVLAIEESLRVSERRVRGLSSEVYRTTRNQDGEVGTRVNIMNVLQQESLLLTRIATEFENKRSKLRSSLKSISVFEFKLPVSLREHYADNSRTDLRAHLYLNIENHSHLLRSNVALMQRHFEEHLVIHNINASFRLQNQVRILAWVTASVALATLVATIVSLIK
jgi:hypothetical protein